MEKEYSKMPKKEELEQLLKQLNRETDSLSDEINMVSGRYCIAERTRVEYMYCSRSICS